MPLYMVLQQSTECSLQEKISLYGEATNGQHLNGPRILATCFDENKQTAFSLIVAPSEKVATVLHRQTFSKPPQEIVEVKVEMIKALLAWSGSLSASNLLSVTTPNITENYQAIMALSLGGSLRLEAATQEWPYPLPLSEKFCRLRQTWQQYGGQEIENGDPVCVICFASPQKAIACALEMRPRSNTGGVKNYSGFISIGISCGSPQGSNGSSLHSAVQLAKRLCLASGGHQALTSASLRTGLMKTGYLSAADQGYIKILSVQEEHFLNRLMDVIEAQWSDAQLTIGALAQQIGVSKSQLYRKMMALKGYSPLRFLIGFRLQKAKQFLANKEGSIASVAYAAGFTSPSYFSRCFQREFGMWPSKYTGGDF